MDPQFCPKCGSRRIRPANLIPLGDPIQMQGYFGWECMDCGYTGKDFFIMKENDYNNGSHQNRRLNKEQSNKGKQSTGKADIPRKS